MLLVLGRVTRLPKYFGVKYYEVVENKFYKIKNSKYCELLPDKKYGEVITSYDKIKEWIESNKDSKEYLFYKNLVFVFSLVYLMFLHNSFYLLLY